MIVVVDLDIFWDSSSPLHDPDSLVVIPREDVPFEISKSKKKTVDSEGNILLTDLHFSPFTPHLGEIFNCLEVHFGSFLQDFTCAIEVSFSLTSSTTCFVEFCKVDVEPVQVRCRLSRENCFQCFGVSLGHLR